MISDPDFFRDFGFNWRSNRSQPDLLIEATPSRDFLGMKFEVLEVPGHCPGSLCFFSRENELLDRRRCSLRRRRRALGFAGRRWRSALRRDPGKTLSARRQRHCPAGSRAAHDHRRGATVESVRALRNQVTPLRSRGRSPRLMAQARRSRETSPNDCTAAGMWLRNSLFLSRVQDIRKPPAPALGVASRRAGTFPRRPDRSPPPSAR